MYTYTVVEVIWLDVTWNLMSSSDTTQTLGMRTSRYNMGRDMFQSENENGRFVLPMVGFWPELIKNE